MRLWVAARTGAALVTSGVDMVCFTGSHATGQRVLRAAADQMIRVQLELGGKDAAYVADDVDVEGAALDVAEGAFYNAGQSCSATERVYVHESIWDRFVAAFVEVVEGYAVGDPEADGTDVGPLARREQLEVLDAQLADATAKGARGPRRRPPARATGQLVRADRRRRRRRPDGPHA